MVEYVIRVQGVLSTELTDCFPTLEVVPVTPGTTLHGQFVDQSALGGVLTHLDLLGVEIVEVLQVPAGAIPMGGVASPNPGETDALHGP